jgi:hypothetical protein
MRVHDSWCGRVFSVFPENPVGVNRERKSVRLERFCSKVGTTEYAEIDA